MDNIFAQKRTLTIVFGNLGRKPYLVEYYLSVYDRDDTRIRYLDEKDEEVACDTLVWLEPNFGETIYKPAYCEHLIVFSSHMFLNYGKEAYIIVHHVGPSYLHDGLHFKRQQLLESIDPSADLVLVPKPFHEPLLPELNEPFQYSICVDLTLFSNAHRAYLALLNAYDFLRSYNYKIYSWCIALPLRLRRTLALNLEKSREKLPSTKVPSNVDCVKLLEKVYLYDDELLLAGRSCEPDIVAKKHIADDDPPEW